MQNPTSASDQGMKLSGAWLTAIMCPFRRDI
jgi:hypothetical protein